MTMAAKVGSVVTGRLRALSVRVASIGMARSSLTCCTRGCIRVRAFHCSPQA